MRVATRGRRSTLGAVECQECCMSASLVQVGLAGAMRPPFANYPMSRSRPLERTRTRADALAEKLRNPPLEVYDSWQELISRAHCDVISIATAPLLRSGPLLMALDQGCHVWWKSP